jgi:hypothetical protein
VVKQAFPGETPPRLPCHEPDHKMFSSGKEGLLDVTKCPAERRSLQLAEAVQNVSVQQQKNAAIISAGGVTNSRSIGNE